MKKIDNAALGQETNEISTIFGRECQGNVRPLPESISTHWVLHGNVKWCFIDVQYLNVCFNCVCLEIHCPPGNIKNWWSSEYQLPLRLTNGIRMLNMTLTSWSLLSAHLESSYKKKKKYLLFQEATDKRPGHFSFSVWFYQELSRGHRLLHVRGIEVTRSHQAYVAECKTGWRYCRLKQLYHRIT